MVEKNNTQRVLEFFFNYPTSIVYMWELSREMKLSMPAIIAEVKKLEHEALKTAKRMISALLKKTPELNLDTH